MCLYVKKSSMVKPIPFQACFKTLRLREVGKDRILAFTTPYQDNLVPFGDGHYVAENYAPANRERGNYTVVTGGYLHSRTMRTDSADWQVSNVLGTKDGKDFDDYAFAAIAIDLCATGTEYDLVSRGLYIPALDLRNYTAARVRGLKRRFPGSFTEHSNEVMAKLGRKI